MDFIIKINLLLAESWPDSGLWEKLIGWFFGFLQNYILTIIIFTIVLKIVLLPLDYWQRKVSKDMTEKQEAMKPELAEIQQKYAADRNVLNQKQMELYKKHNFNIVGSCVAMLINIVLTFGIFITLFTGLGNIANTKIAYQYQELNQVYTQTIASSTAATEAEKIEEANAAVREKYAELKDSFLWIKNIWKSDTATSEIITFKDYKEAIGTLPLAEGETEEQFKAQFNLVMQPLAEAHDGWNGYYILVILAAGTTFLTQFVAIKLNKSKNAQRQPDPSKTTNLIMGIMLPVLMVVFTLSSNAMFGIYIITNSVVSIGLLILTTKLIDMRKKKNDDDVIVVDYKR